MYRGRDEPTFSFNAVGDMLGNSTGLTLGDYDADGDLDVYVDLALQAKPGEDEKSLQQRKV